MALAYMSTFLQFISLYLGNINVKLIYGCFIIIAIIYLIFSYIQSIVENTNKSITSPNLKTPTVKSSSIKTKKSELLKSIQLLVNKIKKT